MLINGTREEHTPWKNLCSINSQAFIHRYQWYIALRKSGGVLIRARNYHSPHLEINVASHRQDLPII